MSLGYSSPTVAVHLLFYVHTYVPIASLQLLHNAHASSTEVEACSGQPGIRNEVTVALRLLVDGSIDSVGYTNQ